MIVFILVFLLFGLPPAEAVETVDDFALFDQQGNFHQLSAYSDQKAIVIVSYGIGCPIVHKSIPALKELRKQFSSLGIVFFFIDPNGQDDREALIQEAEEYAIDFPILEDPAGLVAESLDFVRTAQAVVIDPHSWKIIYQGPIDDRLGYESVREKKENDYLKDALVALLEKKPIPIPTAASKGCLFSRHSHAELTYIKNIAPILQKKCVICHSPGGVAPWNMDSYGKITQWGPMIREVVRTQRMPPWHADPHYGKFQKDLSLSVDQQVKIVHWIERGMKKGTGKDILVRPQSAKPQEWALGPPDVIFSLQYKQDIPEAGRDVYMFLEADRPIDQDLWIRALEIKPGNPRIVHHCNIMVKVKSSAAEDKTLIPDEKKWYMDSGVKVGQEEGGQMIAGYSPGMGPFELPQDTGIFVPKGSRMLFLIHYITTGKPEEDLTKVGLYLSKQKPGKVLSVETITRRDIHIPAGEKNYFLKKTYTFKENVLLTALQPHMHYRGKAMRFSALYPDGKSQILLSVPHYKFGWQRQYVFAAPQFIPAGTIITLEATYDNSAENPGNPDATKDIVYGPGSQEEMFTGIMFFIKQSESPTKR